MATVPQVLLKLPTLMVALAIIVGTAAGVQAATATWDANTEPDLAGYKLSYGTQSGVHTVVLDVGRVTTYQFNLPAGRRYYVVVQAYNSAGELSSKSAEVVVDVPAVTTQPGTSTPQPGAPSTQPPTSAPNLPPTVTPTQPTAPSPSPSPSPSPAPSPDAPSTLGPSGPPPPPGLPAPTPDTPLRLVQPPNQTTRVNASVVFTLTAGHVDNKAFTFTATGLPPGLSLDRVSGVISGTPHTTGFNRVTIAVSDGAFSAIGDFGWAIVDTLPGPPLANQPPALNQPQEQKTAVNGTVAFTLSATDADGQLLTFSAQGLPPGLLIDRSSGLISGTATTSGLYQVTVAVSDGEVSTAAMFRWAVVEMSAATAGSRPEASVDALEDFVDVSGDFDGDGRNDLATYRKSSSEWRIWTSGSNFAKPTVMIWGEAGDRPVPADYNGDRVTDFAVYRPSTGTWHLSLSGTQTPLALQWGGPEDVPVPLDHDGDGKADLGLIRGGGYEILLSSSNFLKSVRVF